MSNALDLLTKTVKALREPTSGCPWDIKQTHESLRRHLIEESYEVIQAINNKDVTNLKEELGDVLLQVLLHSQIASETKKFNLEDVINELNDKLIRRHPHVFEQQHAENADQALAIWEQQKSKERSNQPQEDFAKKIDSAVFPGLQGGPLMHIVAAKAVMMKEALLKGELHKIGKIFDFGHEHKKNMASKISNDLLDEIYDGAKKAGATGGKISGAGGGGFMIFYCPGTTRYGVIKALSKFEGKIIPFLFTQDGLTHWQGSLN